MNRFVDGLGLNVIPEQFAMDGKMLAQGYDGRIEPSTCADPASGL